MRSINYSTDKQPAAKLTINRTVKQDNTAPIRMKPSKPVKFGVGMTITREQKTIPKAVSQTISRTKPKV